MRRSADPDVEVDSSAVVQEIDTLSQAIAKTRLELAIMLVQTDITKSAERGVNILFDFHVFQI